MNTINPLRILIVDDHPAFRRGMLEWIKALPGGHTCEGAENGDIAYNQCLKNTYDAIFMDISMPVMDGITAARLIKKHNPGTPIIILSQYYSKRLVMELIDLGVEGYILKSTDLQELAEALQKVVNGGHYYTPEIFHIWKEFEGIN
jgi:two-component system response regulator DegU